MINDPTSEQGMPDTDPQEWQVQWASPRTQEYLGILLKTGLERQRAISRALDFAMALSTISSFDQSQWHMIAAKAVYQAVLHLRKAGYDI